MEINAEIRSELFDSNICIENVFFMNLLTSSDILPDSFSRIFDLYYEDILSVLSLNENDLKKQEYNLKNKQDLLELLHSKKFNGVLLQFKMPVLREFNFTKNGDFSNCNCSWSCSTWRFVYEKTLYDAIKKTIKIQDDYFNECLENEKKSKFKK